MTFINFALELGSSLLYLWVDLVIYDIIYNIKYAHK